VTSARYTVITCDNSCPASIKGLGVPREVRKAAREVGWTCTRVGGGKQGSKGVDLCPKCSVTYHEEVRRADGLAQHDDRIL
jgi:hypothetical protein